MSTRRACTTTSLVAGIAALASLLLMGCSGPVSAEPPITPSPAAEESAHPTQAVMSIISAVTDQGASFVRNIGTPTGAVPDMRQVGTPTSGVTELATRPPATATLPPVTPPVAVAGKPSGSQLLSRSFYSISLDREMPYFIYLPVGYTESSKRYPVLYMLHGYGGSNTEWLSVGFPEEADKEMNSGEIPQMLIVFPQGDMAYWVNHATDGELWGDYTAKDVVAQIDATYRTVPDAPHRAIGGLSMGGHGAMQLAMNYPGTFSVVGMHSPTLRDFADRFDFFGDQAYFDAHDPTHLVQQYPERARELKIFIDVGEQDADWHDKTVAFHDLLLSEGIAHEFHTWPGQHDGTYWGAHSSDYLHFYAANLAPA